MDALDLLDEAAAKWLYLNCHMVNRRFPSVKIVGGVHFQVEPPLEEIQLPEDAGFLISTKPTLVQSLSWKKSEEINVAFPASEITALRFFENDEGVQLDIYLANVSVTFSYIRALVGSVWPRESLDIRVFPVRRSRGKESTDKAGTP